MEGAILTNASAADRSATDFYPTPPEATYAVARWLQLSGKTVWEPACGAGHMSRALETFGATVVSSELYGQGFGDEGVDFLDASLPEGVEFIVTNPPFKLAEQFIKRSIHHGLPFAMLLKSQYWHSAKRRAPQQMKCAVRGLVVAPRGRTPGAMCSHVITGGKLCGFSGQCEHQRTE